MCSILYLQKNAWLQRSSRLTLWPQQLCITDNATPFNGMHQIIWPSLFCLHEKQWPSPHLLFRGAGMAQWWEHSPPTNMARVRFSDPASNVGWVCWFSSLHREVFSGYSGFPSPQEPKFDLIMSVVNLISNVPNKRSSARKTRHINKPPYLTLFAPVYPPPHPPIYDRSLSYC